MTNSGNVTQSGSIYRDKALVDKVQNYTFVSPTTLQNVFPLEVMGAKHAGDVVAKSSPSAVAASRSTDSATK